MMSKPTDWQLPTDDFRILTLFFTQSFLGLLALKFYLTFAAWQIMKNFLKN